MEIPYDIFQHTLIQHICRHFAPPHSIVPTLKTQYARNTWRTSNLFEGSNVEFEIGSYKGKQVANAITIDEVEDKVRKESAPPPPVVVKPVISMATIPTATTSLATGGSSWANMAAKPAIAPTIIHPPPIPPAQEPQATDEEENPYKDINIANLLNPNNPQYNPELAAKVKLYNKKAKNQKKKEKKEKKKDEDFPSEPTSSPVGVLSMSPQGSPQHLPTSLASTSQGFLGAALGANTPGLGSSTLSQSPTGGPSGIASISPPGTSAPPGFASGGSLSPGLNGLMTSGVPFGGMGDDHNVHPGGNDNLLNPSSSQSSVGGASYFEDFQGGNIFADSNLPATSSGSDLLLNSFSFSGLGLNTTQSSFGGASAGQSAFLSPTPSSSRLLSMGNVSGSKVSNRLSGKLVHSPDPSQFLHLSSFFP